MRVTKKANVLICGFSQDEYAELSAVLADIGIDSFHAYAVHSALYAINRGASDLLFLDSDFAEDYRPLLFALPQEAMCPVIVFGRRHSEAFELGSFEAGADDYIVWPHSPRIAAARANALLKRCGKSVEVERILVGNLVLYPGLYRAFSGGKEIFLAPGDNKLLCLLARNVGKVLTREQIQNEIWSYDYDSSPRAVDTQVKRLRKAMAGMNTGVAIRSVYGVGYKLVLNNNFFE
ncbi:MAG: response regulator transcription factor [Ruminococcaceae bacterium]|nr:response regulator transcription factor [Oscillospiraceae bacterium]